jgi:predicted nucleotidyltransferase
METPFAVLSEITRALEEMGIAYVVVGSFASSMRGLYRATADVDIVADIKADQIKSLVTALQENFYLDEQAVRRAVAQHRSFNAIHFDSVFKVDIFIPPESDFSRQQLINRQLEKLAPDVERGIYVATAEDSILAKLSWYRAGGEISDTQWSDVLGIIGMQGEHLDFEYLREWAAKLKVLDLLEKALTGENE